MEDIIIRALESQDMDNAIRLILDVFNEFEAPDYSEEGVREFYGSIRNDDFMNSLCFIGAFKDNELAGIIATRNEGSHIALLFVEKKFQMLISVKIVELLFLKKVKMLKLKTQHQLKQKLLKQFL